MAAAAMHVGICFWICLTLISSSGVESKPLYFSLMVSSAAGQNTSGVVPSVERALQEINSDPNILAAGYSLNYTRVLDTECNSTKGLQLFHEDLQSNKTVLAVVGCGCSFATELVSKVSYLNHIVVISYASTSIVLNDGSVYHSFFRTIPSDELIPAALVTVMDYYNWTRLAVVSERKKQYIENFNAIRKGISQSNFTLFLFDSDIQELLLLLSEENSVREQHIFYLNMAPRNALLCLCKATQSRCYYPHYLWIVPGWYSNNWWKDFPNYLKTINCTQAQIEQALNRSLTLLPVPAGKLINNLPNPSSYATDAVKALGLAINASTVSCISQERQCMFNSITKTLRNIKFNGLSGVVSFNNAGGRAGSQVVLQQYRQQYNIMKKTVVATLSENTTKFYVNGENDSTMWPDGIPPDGSPIVLTIGLNLLVSVFVYVLVGIAGVFGIICLLFNILFHNRKVVRLTSPKLNYAIIFGSMLQVAFLVTYNINIDNLEVLAIICAVRRACVNLGHNISFSLAMLKAWRVHYIFKNPKPGKRAPQDWMLLMITCGLVMVDGILLTLFIPDLLYRNSGFQMDEGTSDNGVGQILNIPNCGTTPYYLIWLGLAIGYKLALHVVALVLAFRTQTVQVDALNDSKYTVAIIYISSILMIVLLFVIVFINSQINIYTAALAVLISLDVYSFLGLTFIPKMIVLYKDPRGKNIFAKTCSGTAEASHSTITQATNPLYRQRKGSLSLKESCGNVPKNSKEQDMNALRI